MPMGDEYSDSSWMEDGKIEDGIMPAEVKLRTTTRNDRGVIGRAGRIV
jgi:hypothetical protein